MPEVKFRDARGIERSVHFATGKSAMQAAANNLVPGILGDCGGTATCGTCHVYVAEEFLARLTPPGDAEEMTLSGVMAPRLHSSRLSCQIILNDELDGLILTVPDEQ